MIKYLTLALAFVILCVVPVTAQSTDNKEPHLGLIASFAPAWEANTSTFRPVFSGLKEVNIGGAGYEIGILRGSEGGGDWGVSFVRRNIRNSSQLVRESHNHCVDMDSKQYCAENTDQYGFSGASLYGVQAHKFMPLVSIKKRVQIGLNLGGGVGVFSGQAVRSQRLNVFNFDRSDPKFNTQDMVTNHDLGDLVVDEGGFKYMPLIKAELAASVLVAPGFKLRFGGGFNFPGMERFSVQGIVLFGVKRNVTHIAQNN